MRRHICLLIVILAVCFAAPLYAHHVKQAAAPSMPVTTSSAQARALYEKGMQDYENLYLERCNEDWRAAVKADPNLAVAWAWIAFNSSNPQEVSAAREKAKSLAPKLTQGEQLMVSWIVKVQEGDFIGGIAAMNDLLEMFPKDKHLLYLAGNWLMGENGDEQARRIMEKALALDKNYRAALKIDQDFVTSQVGVADTYALMGNQEQARIEYDKAIRYAHNEADRLLYSMQKATTWVREGKFAEADKLLQEIAQNAHAKEQDLQEAQAYRQAEEYQADDNAALKYLQSAEESLGHRATISKGDKDEELSRILRNRAVRAAHAGNPALADRSLKQLEAMASGTRNRVIVSSYNGAAGTLLIDQKKFEEAVTYLEEDQDNPFTMELLVQAYYQTNQSDKLHAIEAKLRGTNVATMEQAVVVPAVRLHRPQI